MNYYNDSFFIIGIKLIFNMFRVYKCRCVCALMCAWCWHQLSEAVHLVLWDSISHWDPRDSQRIPWSLLPQRWVYRHVLFMWVLGSNSHFFGLKFLSHFFTCTWQCIVGHFCTTDFKNGSSCMTETSYPLNWQLTIISCLALAITFWLWISQL